MSHLSIAAGAVTLTAVAAVGGISCAPRGPEDLMRVLETHPGLREVVSNADAHRLQIVVGTVEVDPDTERRVLRQETFRAGAEYFYPASSVKLFAAIAALERLAELRAETGRQLDLDTPLVLHPLFEGEELEQADETNLQDGSITVRHEIRKLFLVSDNQAFNRLYELVGQDGLAASLARAGLGEARIVHRLSERRSAEENLRSPRIDLFAGDTAHRLAERTAEALPPAPAIAGIEVGSAYLASGEKIESAMDFTAKNRMALADLQRGLCMVVRPEVDCGGAGFRLAPQDRAVLQQAMRELPGESSNPIYNPEDYPDDYVKFLLPGLKRLTRGPLKIYNKVGMAYGFTTENAYVVGPGGRDLFLAATIYTNEDGVLNDDRYEYDEVALPFLADLGEAVARWKWKGIQ